jgi:hypothetical protein
MVMMVIKVVIMVMDLVARDVEGIRIRGQKLVEILRRREDSIVEGD